MKIMVYDAEIENAIPEKGVAPVEGIRYAKHWGDHEGMGVAVICAYIWDEGYHVFLRDSFETFKTYAEAPDVLCVGYNNRVFDDLLVRRALGIHIAAERSWDLLRAVRVALGNSPGSVGGPTLDALCRANFLAGKSGNGAFAPILWQKARQGCVIDYCLNDVQQTVKLVELVIAGRLRDPDSGRILKVAPPAASPLAAVSA